MIRRCCDRSSKAGRDHKYVTFSNLPYVCNRSWQNSAILRRAADAHPLHCPALFRIIPLPENCLYGPVSSVVVTRLELRDDGFSDNAALPTVDLNQLVPGLVTVRPAARCAAVAGGEDALVVGDDDGSNAGSVARHAERHRIGDDEKIVIPVRSCHWMYLGNGSCLASGRPAIAASSCMTPAIFVVASGLFQRDIWTLPMT